MLFLPYGQAPPPTHQNSAFCFLLFCVQQDAGPCTVFVFEVSGTPIIALHLLAMLIRMISFLKFISVAIKRLMDNKKKHPSVQVKIALKHLEHSSPPMKANTVVSAGHVVVTESVSSRQVLGNVTEFQRAVKLVIDTVSFDKNSTVQVFEANIRYVVQTIDDNLS